MKNDINSNTEAYVFLFDADADAFGGFYGVPCGKMVLDAVLALGQPIRSRIYSGDMLLAMRCQRISAVRKSPAETCIELYPSHDLYLTLLTDLVRSIKEQENVIAIPHIASVLGTRNIYAFTVCGMTPESWKSVCRQLKRAAGFAASFRLDMGNPLHTDLFIESLIPHGFLSGSELFLMRSPFEEMDEEELIPCWVEGVPGIRVRFLDAQEYDNQCPPLHDAEKLSEAGMRYVELFEKKGELSPYERLALALLRNDDVTDCDFSISSPFSWEQVDVPEKKLTQYALNLEHEGSGKSKAELFQRLLNITKEDWRYLAAQIENAMESGSLCGVRQTEYGVQFHIDIPIKGLNDASRTVRTAWIIRQPQKCSLTTAYILNQSQQKEAEGQTPPVVRDTNPELFYSILYSYAGSAGNRAAENCIPTPMYILGYEEPIRACGFAWVVIHDARKRFPRWLKKQGIGYAGYRGGWIVQAKNCGQSVEKARAYADAFAKVLRQNGIDCHAASRLD